MHSMKIQAQRELSQAISVEFNLGSADWPKVI